MKPKSGWMADIAIGVLAGGVIGAVIAVNFIITIGIGYDVSIPDIFRDNVLAGIVTVAILVGSPVIGVVFMRRQRHKREQRAAPNSGQST